MRKGLLLLAGVSLLTTSLVAQAAQTAQTAPPAASQAEKKSVKVSEDVLKTYVGEYELRADWILTVTLEKGVLWGQPTNQERRELVAESPTKFFLRDLPVTMEFKKDDKGKVTGLHMIQEGRGARDLPKIK